MSPISALVATAAFGGLCFLLGFTVHAVLVFAAGNHEDTSIQDLYDVIGKPWP